MPTEDTVEVSATSNLEAYMYGDRALHEPDPSVLRFDTLNAYCPDQIRESLARLFVLLEWSMLIMYRLASRKQGLQ